MADEKEPFLARWSRLKREQPAAPALPAAVPPAQAAKPLPAIESLTPQSDFTAFMQPTVKEDLRRMALKKLFRDPHFNVPDPFEPYSGDWTVGEPIPPDLLATLNQARTVLLTPEERKALEEKEQAALEAAKPQETPAPATQPQPTQAKETKADEPGRQDT
jgi:hypothetical protein